jgi:type I restriction enzyme, R subunit
MTEFKQIIGRGTRINEDYNKLFFTIMDFKRGHRLFADPDFDGDPVQIYEPGPEEPPVSRREIVPERTRRTDPPDGPPEPTWRRGRGRSPAKYYVDNVEVRVATERVQYLDADGKLITESLKDYTRKAVRQTYASWTRS